MSSHRLKVPKIGWGAAFANTLTFGYPIDNATAGDEPRTGSEAVQAPSGAEDAWTAGTDYVLAGDARWVPQVDTSSPVATGWDGSTGWRAFLAWARDKNLIRFYPDAADSATHTDCYLVDPMTGQGASESDGTRKVSFKIRNTSAAFDGY